MATQLTYKDMEAMRMLANHGPDRLAGYGTGKLERTGCITRASRGDGRFELTARGERMVADWVRDTGDGPEQLKSILSRAFGGGR